jgi:hypothetical protein
MRFLDPKNFGDDWSQELEKEERDKISKYFKAVQHLERHFDFINVRVAQKDHIVELAKTRFNRGITFEAPRFSLTLAVENEVFDDC